MGARSFIGLVGIAGLIGVGCGEDPAPAGESDGSETGTPDADSSTSSPADTTESEGLDSSSSDSGDSTTGPTVGEDPPTFVCGRGGVFDGTVIIEPTEEQGPFTPIEELDGISVIDGDLLVNSTTYNSLDFLNCITEVRGDIQIYGNAFLTDTHGLDALVTIGRPPQVVNGGGPGGGPELDNGKGTMTISNNAGLVDIDGIAGLIQIPENQSLVIRENASLVTITGFDTLTAIDASLVIQENPVLMDIDGLIGLAGLGGAFAVTRNPLLCMSSVEDVIEGLVSGPDPEFSTTELNDEGC